MSIFRFSKVRITNHRPPPGAGAVSPVERSKARPRAVASADSQHDKWVAMFQEPELRQMLADLEERRSRGGDWALNNWVERRVSALRRRLEGLS